MPSNRTAECITAALPLPHHERAAWLTFVKEYWRIRRCDVRQPRSALTFDPKMATTLRIRYERVQFGSITEAGGDSYERVHHDATQLVAQIVPDAGDLGRQFTGLCTILTDTSSVLGRRTEALYWARHASNAAGRLALPRNDEVWAAYVLEQQVNSLRAEAVELNRIGLRSHCAVRRG
jgi:hypothetical protein